MVASMRPRHKAAENDGLYGEFAPRIQASMRPRHKAAENRLECVAADAQALSFNEAAA